MELCSQMEPNAKWSVTHSSHQVAGAGCLELGWLSTPGTLVENLAPVEGWCRPDGWARGGPEGCHTLPRVTRGGSPELPKDNLGLCLWSQAGHQACTGAVAPEGSPGPEAQSGSSGPSHLVPIRAPSQDPVASADHNSPTRPPGRPEATEEVREAEEGAASARQQ